MSFVTNDNKYIIYDYIKAISKPTFPKTALIMTQKEKQLLIDFYDKNKEIIMEAILAKSTDLNESNPQAFSEAWQTLGGVSSNTYSVNGQSGVIMWRVVAKFAEELLKLNTPIKDIEIEIRTMVGTPNTKIKYFDDNPNSFNLYSSGKPRCNEFSYLKKKYYVTDQWTSGGNFARFVTNVNAKYRNNKPFSFVIK